MKRIIRDRRLTPEEAAKYNKIMEHVEKEFPPIKRRSSMQPGPELDRAVAEAVGFNIGPYGCGNPLFVSIPGQPPTPLEDFHPSTDANDALLAAETCGLFMCNTQSGEGPYQRCLYQGGGGYWWIGDQKYGTKHHDSISAQTPAHAICLAILEVTGNTR